MARFVSTKTYSAERGFSVAYRQWRADSHCRLIHGYSIGIHLEFSCDENDLDSRNWCTDFGSFKSLKYLFDDWFDHTLLVAKDDPEFKTFEDLHNKDLCKMVVVDRTGCEGLAKFISEYIIDIWLPENGYAPRVSLDKVEIRETPSNSAMWVR